MLNLYAKFQGFMLNGFKDMLPLISHVSSVLVQCITSLAQAVTSQAEKREPIKSIFLVVMPEYLFSRDIPRPAGCGISPLKFEMAP